MSPMPQPPDHFSKRSDTFSTFQHVFIQILALRAKTWKTDIFLIFQQVFIQLCTEKTSHLPFHLRLSKGEGWRTGGRGGGRHTALGASSAHIILSTSVLAVNDVSALPGGVSCLPSAPPAPGGGAGGHHAAFGASRAHDVLAQSTLSVPEVPALASPGELREERGAGRLVASLAAECACFSLWIFLDVSALEYFFPGEDRGTRWHKAALGARLFSLSLITRIAFSSGSQH